MQKEKLKICVFGSFGNRDIGDDAMLTEHLNNLYKLGIQKNQIDILPHQKKYGSDYSQIPINQCYEKYELINPTDYNFLIITGGGTINTRDEKGNSVKRMHKQIKRFKQNNIPIFMSGQTIGPLGINRKHDTLAKEIIESVDCLTVRDDSYSFDYIKKIGANPKNVQASFDDASNLSLHPVEQKIDDLFVGEKVVALNLTRYTANTDLKKQAIKELSLKIMNDGYRIIFIPHHNWDYQTYNKIMEGTPGFTTCYDNQKSDRIISINTWNWRAEKIKYLMSKCTACIGGRYHFFVLASSTGVPTIGMAGNEYSYIKQNGFAKMFGNSDCVFYKNNYSVNYIYEKFKAIESRRNNPISEDPLSMKIFKEWLDNKTK